MIGIKDQYFGTEIEMTGITRQRAAEVVAEMFGTEAYYDGTTYGVWSVIDLEGKKWKFMSDVSCPPWIKRNWFLQIFLMLWLLSMQTGHFFFTGTVREKIWGTNYYMQWNTQTGFLLVLC